MSPHITFTLLEPKYAQTTDCAHTRTGVFECSPVYWPCQIQNGTGVSGEITPSGQAGELHPKTLHSKPQARTVSTWRRPALGLRGWSGGSETRPHRVSSIAAALSSWGAQRRRISLRAESAARAPAFWADDFDFARVFAPPLLQIPPLQNRHTMRNVPSNNVGERLHRHRVPASHAASRPRLGRELPQQRQG